MTVFTKTSIVIERGAEAMRQKRRELIAQPLDRIWPDLMRAAVEAMREPNAVALDGALLQVIHIDSGSTTAEIRAALKEAWEAMIDAALSEQPLSKASK